MGVALFSWATSFFSLPNNNSSCGLIKAQYIEKIIAPPAPQIPEAVRYIGTNINAINVVTKSLRATEGSVAIS